MIPPTRVVSILTIPIVPVPPAIAAAIRTPPPVPPPAAIAIAAVVSAPSGRARTGQGFITVLRRRRWGRDGRRRASRGRGGRRRRVATTASLRVHIILVDLHVHVVVVIHDVVGMGRRGRWRRRRPAFASATGGILAVCARLRGLLGVREEGLEAFALAGGGAEIGDVLLEHRSDVP